MKRKFLMITLLLGILLGGCSNSRDSSPAVAEDTDAWEYDFEAGDYEETDFDYGNDTYGEETEEVVMEAYPFAEIYPFSNGRAWVNFKKDDIAYTGMIDTEGKVLYQAEDWFFYVSPFEDGMAFYRKGSEETSPCGIIDLDGNVLFESQITSDGGYLILGYGNGHFLVKQHIQNFETDEWRYGTINEHGDILNEMKTGEISEMGELYHCESRYIGENFIALATGVYNIETSVFSYFPSSSMGLQLIMSDFYEGNAVMVVEAGISDPVALVIDANFVGYIDDDGYYQGFVSKHEIDDLSIYSKGLIWNAHEDGEAGYYDKDWNVVISLEKYRDKDIKGVPLVMNMRELI